MTEFIFVLAFVVNTFVAFIIGGTIIYRLAKAKGLKNVSRDDCIWVTWWASPIVAALYYGLMPNGTDLKNTKAIKESAKAL